MLTNIPVSEGLKVGSDILEITVCKVCEKVSTASFAKYNVTFREHINQNPGQAGKEKKE